MPLPLSSLRVIDATNSIAGPFAGMILGDLGADVLKIEPPERGDISRSWGPQAFGGMSTSFLACNRNKSSITIDLATQRGRRILHDLVKTADILLTNTLPSKQRKLGLDYETCVKENENLIYCVVSAYGQSGPMQNEPGYDALMQARTGIMSITGTAGQDTSPIRIASSIIDMGTSFWSVMGILAAVIERKDTGRGKRVDTSLFETAIAWSPQQIMTYFATNEIPRKYGSGVEMIAPYEAYAATDGHIMVAANTEAFWQKLCQVLGLAHLLADSRYVDNRSRVQNRAILSKEIENRIRQNTCAYWQQRLSEVGVPCEPVASIADVVRDEQANALGMIRKTQQAFLEDQPDSVEFLDIPPPFTLDGKRPSVRQLPPRLGEHTREILLQIGYSDETISELISQGIVTTSDVA